jgi:hypothetical protein
LTERLKCGTKERPFRVPHAIAAGIERYPRKVTKHMGQKKLAHRSNLKVMPFIKVLAILISESDPYAQNTLYALMTMLDIA